MALWESLGELLKKSSLVIIGTTLLFSLGHLMSFYAVPLGYKPFILIQTLYVILLGLGAGYARLITGSVTAAMVVHFCFNFGFFLAFF